LKGPESSGSDPRPSEYNDFASASTRWIASSVQAQAVIVRDIARQETMTEGKRSLKDPSSRRTRWGKRDIRTTSPASVDVLAMTRPARRSSKDREFNRIPSLERFNEPKKKERPNELMTVF